MDYFEDSSQIMKDLLEQRQVQSSDTLLVSLCFFYRQATDDHFAVCSQQIKDSM